MASFYPTDFDAFNATGAEPECALNDAHDYAKWQFQLAVRDLMENHGYTETELAAMVVDAMPLAEECEFELTIPADVPF